jgi:hypothetical protein
LNHEGHEEHEGKRKLSKLRTACAAGRVLREWMDADEEAI